MAYQQLQQQNTTSPAAAYTEFSFRIPARVNEFTLQCRNLGATLFWYTAPSGSPSPGVVGNLPAVYGTIPPGNNRTIRGLIGAQTIYVQSDTPSVVVEQDFYADI